MVVAVEVARVEPAERAAQAVPDPARATLIFRLADLDEEARAVPEPGILVQAAPVDQVPADRVSLAVRVVLAVPAQVKEALVPAAQAVRDRAVPGHPEKAAQAPVPAAPGNRTSLILDSFQE